MFLRNTVGVAICLKVTSATKLFFVIKQRLMCNKWIFLFEEKIIFRSRDIKIFVFLWNLQISKFVLLHNASYTYAYCFWILSPIKIKFGQILVCYMTVWQTFLTYFWLNAGDWKLVPGSFMILLKWQYSKIWSFLMVDIYHF